MLYKLIYYINGMCTYDKCVGVFETEEDLLEYHKAHRNTPLVYGETEHDYIGGDYILICEDNGKPYEALIERGRVAYNPNPVENHAPYNVGVIKHEYIRKEKQPLDFSCLFKGDSNAN